MKHLNAETRRLRDGRFPAGVSGNPAGPPRDWRTIKAACQEFSVEARDKLVEIMRGKDRRLALEAATRVLERGWGRIPTVEEVI